MRKVTEGLPAPFFDLAISIVLVLLAIFLISTLEDPKPSDGIVTPKAEFMITMDWDDGSNDDVDLYVKSPDGKVVYYASKTAPVMFLDQDNLGFDQNVKMPNGETKPMPTRREIVTIRAIMPGTYTVNARLHSKRTGDGTENHVRVQVIKINPFSVVTQAETKLSVAGQERTLVNMTVNDKGDVSEIFEGQTKMVGAKPVQGQP